MIDFLYQYGMFLAQVVTLVVAILVVIGGIVSAAARNRHRVSRDGELRVKHLNEEFDDLRESIVDQVLPDAERKAEHKKKRKEEKARNKQRKKAGAEAKSKPRMFVLDFNGDIQASDVARLRREISAVLEVATGDDEVLLRLESPGGLVHSYGLAASQLKRLRGRGVKLTVAVDQVAASGGYMMACIADRILAAPFAVIGSIGVVAQVPNFHRLLKKNDIDVELMTAGEYKRTLTMLGENTDKGREKFQQELEETHQLFKGFVREHRRTLDLDAVATGEHWFGTRAKELGLVDEIMTSDEYLQGRKEHLDLYELNWEYKRKLAERLGVSVENAGVRLIDRFLAPGQPASVSLTPVATPAGFQRSEAMTFKALITEKTDDGYRSRVGDKHLEELPEGDVLVRVAWSSLNYKDALSASGNKGVTRSFPHTPGIDAAGVVEEAGDGPFSVGDAVICTGYDLGMNTSGGYGDYIRVPAEWLAPLPAGLSARDAMVLGTAGLTAALCVEALIDTGLQPEQGEVLVTGATGGVGSVAVSILSKLGFKVVAATGKQDAHDWLRDLGAADIIGRDALLERH